LRFRVFRCLLTALAVLILVPAQAAPVAASVAKADPKVVKTEPKVVIVVGPVGEATDRYRALADEAAVAARRHTSRVTTLYSPNATWTRVKAALQGASMLVYLGHGNGWPSPHRSAAWPYSQNGLGLNVAGSTNDEEVQYYGEYFLRGAVKLAPNAVVIFSHLCYASGNSQPGMPEDGLDIAWQRVDNYAAAFMAIGASAVIADARLDPSYYVDQALRANRRIADVWMDAPSFHGNVLERESRRTPGYRRYVDPDSDGTGFYRSLVVRPGLRSGHLIQGARTGKSVDLPVGSDPGPDLPPAVFGNAITPDVPTAGRAVRVTLPITSGRDRLPENLTFNVRWDALALDGSTPVAPEPAAEPSATPNDQPGDATAWIVPERLGAVVQTELAKLRKEKVTARVLVPDVLGLYRLTITVADADGADLPTTQVTQPGSSLVRVISALGVAYLTTVAVDADPGESVVLPVGVTNSGAGAWWAEVAPGVAGTGKLMATWVALGLNAPAPPQPAVTDVPLLAPGGSQELALELVAPTAPGEYLVLLDVLAPDGTSMAAQGVPPHLLRVSVVRPGTTEQSTRDSEPIVWGEIVPG
jgi:hypothetical protein